MSGKVDLISDGKRVLAVDNGHSMMSSVTGIGCLATTFFVSAVEEGDRLLATTAALAFVGIAGERAAKQFSTPASFEIGFLGELYKITPNDLRAECKVREILPQ